MQQSANFDGHLVRVEFMERERFGFISEVEVFDKLHRFLYEVINEKTEMPVGSIEHENIICDYGDSEGWYGEYDWLGSWVGRIHSFSAAMGVTNFITHIRAALIACGDLTIKDGDPELIAGLKNAQTQFGKDVDAWSDEAINIALRLSLNEEARSVQEIENRTRLAKMIADHINSGNN